MDPQRTFVESLESHRQLFGDAFGWGPLDRAGLDIDRTDAADQIEGKLSDDGAKVQVLVNGSVAEEADVDDVKFLSIVAWLFAGVFAGDGADTIVGGDATDSLTGGTPNDDDDEITDDGANRPIFGRGRGGHGFGGGGPFASMAAMAGTDR
jgi:hypothetical protein